MSKKTFALSKDFTIPAALHKYIIGGGGSNIKAVETENNVKLTLKGDITTIQGDKDTDIAGGFEALRATLTNYGWFFDGSKFYEDLEIQKVFAAAQSKVEKSAKAMQDAFEGSKKAFNAGDKAKAKQLSDEGKKHQQEMQQASREAAEKVFQFANKTRPFTEIDLHGLHVEFAIEFLTTRLDESKKKGSKTLTVITGMN